VGKGDIPTFHIVHSAYFKLVYHPLPSFGTATIENYVLASLSGLDASRVHDSCGSHKSSGLPRRLGDRGRCTHCGGSNHIIDRCWDLHGKPAWRHQVVCSLDGLCPSCK